MREVELGEIASYQNGYAFKPDDWSKNGLPIIRIQNLNDPDKEYNHYEGDDIDERYFVQDGDVLIAWSASLGVYVWNRGDAWLNQHTFKVNFESDEVDKSYFVYAIQEVLKKIENKLHGSTMKHITKKKFLKLKIPLPSLSEQKTIVAKLDRAQRLIDIDKEMLAKYDELIQSVFLEMFGDPVTNPKGWKVKTLKELGDIQTGKTPSTKVEEYFEGDIPFVTPSDLGKNSISPTRFLSKDGLEKSRKVKQGTTLVCCIGATIGKIGMTEKISGFNQQINSIEWNNDFVLDEVGYQGMRFFKDEIKSNAKSTTLPILKKSLFEGLKFPVFEKDLQENFVDMFYRIKLQKEETDKSLKKSEALFSSLVQGAFG